MTASSELEINDFLEDSLTYSPLRELQNQENSPSLFFKTLERAKRSPSTAKLFALLGGGILDANRAGSPVAGKPVARRLEDLLNTPEQSPRGSTPSVVPDVNAELVSLRLSLASIQKDCEFHRQRAIDAHDELAYIKKYVSQLEEDRRQSSMDSLNKSLSKQNDLLRSRSSVASLFSKKDSFAQTDQKTYIETGMHTEEGCMSPIGRKSCVVDTSPVDTRMSFMGTPSCAVSPHYRFHRPTLESETQTATGIWATVEELTVSPQLPIPSRKSLPPRVNAPVQTTVHAPVYTRLEVPLYPRRGKSLGARPRWVP